MKVFFKFTSGVSAPDREAILRAVQDRTGCSATRLFPGTDVDELTRHYLVDCRVAAKASALVAHLSSLPQIEYAETAVKRSLQ